jgi:long-chain fatty acid transport protein
MKRILLATSAMIAAASGAQAGGVERSSQSVAILFEQGRYAELSYGRFSPDVSGTVGGGAVSSGDMAGDYNSWSLGYKMDIGDRMALAMILDQPIGANVNYPTGTGYPLGGSTAELTSSAITALLKYKFENNVSVYGGLRYETVHGVVSLPSVGGYALDTNHDSELGYVVGVAWEKPEIAARVALSYNSAITHTLNATERLGGGTFIGTFDTEVPASLNLEFQTGIAKDTLLFGSIRWVDWTAFVIDPPAYPAPLGNLVDYASDRVTYNLGIGRRFNENWSGAVTLGYEKADGARTGNLGPTDGYRSIGLAATYTMDNMKISGGIRYVDLGDATTNPPINGSFTDNSGVGFGIRVGYSF